jgi:hypothetical protein
MIPKGILKAMAGSALADIVRQFEEKPSAIGLDLCEILLNLNESALEQLRKGLEQIARRARLDGGCHDLSMGLSAAGTGLTIHCSAEAELVAMEALRQHCETRKYIARTDTWLGLCIRPDCSVRFVVENKSKWQRDDALDSAVQSLDGKSAAVDTARRKPGRNEPCICGSGRKFKKCCG